MSGSRDDRVFTAVLIGHSDLIGHSGGAGGFACATAWPTRSLAEMPTGATTG
jgi:hypothetical protein